jgi:YbgC/YbaW family acyl-CoA thioester hydrolase
MPLTHERTFRIRHYECDVHGFARYASYLNYLQESAFDASAAAGYDLSRYASMGCHWLVRETDIQCRRPVRYGESVAVKTWVADFRRVRSRRAYELRLVGSGELVAEARTDWVFLDSTTGHPVTIPLDMMEAFFPEGVPSEAPPRRRFPSVSVPSIGAFQLERRVVWSDVDPAGHVNNAVYLAYLEDGEAEAAAAGGWPHQRMAAEGFALVARRHQIEYRQPAVLGDELELRVWLSGLDECHGMWHHAIIRAHDGGRLAQARTHWECVDVETRQPIPVPPQFVADLTQGVAVAQP